MRNSLMRLSFVAIILALAGACSVVRSAALHEPQSGALTYLGGVAIPPDGHFGGLSGLAVSPDAATFTAISDEGTFVTGRLIHDKTGNLAAVDGLVQRNLGGVEPGNKQSADSEALVRTADGGWLVSFERDHRILAYPPDLAGRPRLLSGPRDMRTLPANEGVEALTILHDGRIVAIAEAQENDDGIHRAWIGREGDWKSFGYRSDPLYQPSDAAVLPDGDLLVLERHFSLLLGLKVRLVLVPAESLVPDTIVEGMSIGDVAPPIGGDNFEGLAVRRTETGAIHSYIISDDNFSSLQKTLLVQYELHLAPKLPGRAR